MRFCFTVTVDYIVFDELIYMYVNDVRDILDEDAIDDYRDFLSLEHVEHDIFRTYFTEILSRLEINNRSGLVRKLAEYSDNTEYETLISRVIIPCITDYIYDNVYEKLDLANNTAYRDWRYNNIVFRPEGVMVMLDAEEVK